VRLSRQGLAVPSGSLRLHNLLFVPGSPLLLAAAQIVAQCLRQALFLRGPFGSLCRGQFRKIFHFGMQQKRDEHVNRRSASRPAASVKDPPALPNLKLSLPSPG
jgi:hypothetical protein